MKLQVVLDVNPDKIEQMAQQALDNHWQLKEMVTRAVNDAYEKAIREMDLSALARERIQAKVQQVADDVIYGQLKHLVKLAVDRELAAARAILQMEGNQ